MHNKKLLRDLAWSSEHLQLKSMPLCVCLCMYVCMYVWTSAWLIVGTLKQRLGLVLLLWQHYGAKNKTLFTLLGLK